jgi:putative flippase GtrA
MRALIRAKWNVAKTINGGTTSRPATFQFFRFICAGLLNAAFGYGVFALLLLTGAGVGTALVVATVGGIAFNFQTSQRVVFRSAGRVVRFVAMYCAVLALNWLALRAFHAFGLSELQGQALLVLPIGAI